MDWFLGMTLSSLDENIALIENMMKNETAQQAQVAQAHVSRKSQRLIHERVTRYVTRC